MNRHRSLLALLGALLLTPRAHGQTTPPNIVIMLYDNLGYGELGSYGGGITSGAETPQIDKLA